MLNIQYTTQFKKDFKRIKKQQKDLSKLQYVIEELANEIQLPPKYRDHSLIGNWKNHNECHIESDWILIYRISQDTLILERTGSHSELYKK